MRLTDGAVTLLPADTAHIDGVLEAARASLPELIAWMPWAHPDYGPDDVRGWIEKAADDDARHEFVVVLGGKIVGAAGIWRTEDGWGEVGYWVRTDATGGGIATRATRLLVALGLDELGFDEIRIRADPANLASQRVAEKAGGVRRAAHQVHTHDDGSVHELVEFVVVRG